MADRDIPEEIVEKGARALARLKGWEFYDEFTHQRMREDAEAVLSAALAGRQVVDLPEPDTAPGRWGCIADWHPVVWEITAHLHANGEPRVDDDDRMLTADAAERHGLALIAAARAARRYADERRAAGSGSGEN